jgi:hypothetical protein
VVGLALEGAARGDVEATEIDARMEARIAALPDGLASLDAPLPAGIDGRRHSPELLRVRADSAGRGRVGLLWVMDPQTRLNSLGAGVRTTNPIPAAISSRIVASEADSCVAGLVAPPALELSAAGPWAGEDPLSLGPLDRAEWTDLPAVPPNGASDPTAWFTDHALSLGAGAWEGIVLVDGDLELRSGARMEGWIAVTGDLHVGDGAIIVGIVRAGGTVVIDPGGTIEVAPCGAILTLRDIPRFAFPVAIGATAWPADLFQ